MKKFLLLMMSYFFIGTHAMAQTPEGNSSPIDFSTGWIDPTPMGHPASKSPIAPPTVYLEDYTLTFMANHPEYVLYIKDEDEEVVYSTVVTSAETQVTLPTYLTGSYKIELVMGNWCFWGYITL